MSFDFDAVIDAEEALIEEAPTFKFDGKTFQITKTTNQVKLLRYIKLVNTSQEEEDSGLDLVEASIDLLRSHIVPVQRKDFDKALENKNPSYKVLNDMLTFVIAKNAGEDPKE